MDWDPIRRRMAESFFDLLHAAEAVEPSVDMTTNAVPRSTRANNVCVWHRCRFVSNTRRHVQGLRPSTHPGVLQQLCSRLLGIDRTDLDRRQVLMTWPTSWLPVPQVARVESPPW